MFEKDQPVIDGMLVRHDEEGGLRYRIDEFDPGCLSATGYEKTHKVGGGLVKYTQLEKGSYPAGQRWNRTEEDFRENFTAIEE